MPFNHLILCRPLLPHSVFPYYLQWRSLEDRMCKHRKGLNPTGTILWPYHSISRADPCWQHQTPLWASSLTASPSQGVLLWDLSQPVSSSIECNQNTSFPGWLFSEWVAQSPWLHSGSWQALERASCLFCSFSQCSQEAQKACSSDREHRIQKGSLWGGVRLFIKQANTFPPRKF